MKSLLFIALALLALAIGVCLTPAHTFSTNATTDMRVALLVVVTLLVLCIILLVVDKKQADKREAAYYVRQRPPMLLLLMLAAVGLLSSCEPTFSKGVTKSGLVVHLDLSQVEHDYQPGELVVTHQSGLLYVAQPWAQTDLKHTYLDRGRLDTLTVLEIN